MKLTVALRLRTKICCYKMVGKIDYLCPPRPIFCEVSAIAVGSAKRATIALDQP